jgi:hypothetical protein
MQNALDSNATPTGDALVWHNEPVGLFSGIKYAVKNVADGLDPYFIWADMNGFANLRKPGQKPEDMSHLPKYLPILIQLNAKVSPLELSSYSNAELNKIPPLVLLSPRPTNPTEMALQKGAVVPARATAAFFKAYSETPSLRSLIELIKLDSLQNALPPVVPPLAGAVNTTRQTVRPISPAGVATVATANSSLKNQTNNKLKKKVVAFIDDGCAFAHAHFLTDDPAQPGTPLPRVKRLWDMNVRAAGAAQSAPAIFQPLESPAREYGREFTDVDLKALIVNHTHAGRVDEDALYAEFAAGTQYNINRLRGRAAHGTHVMDLACGPYKLADTLCARPNNAAAGSPTWAKAQDDASTAPIIFVQLPMNTVRDTTLRYAMQQDVINALEYIIDVCDKNADIVVNLSWGTFAGPHTGTNLLERKIDQLITLHGKRLKVVIPAGNGYQSRTHANFELDVGQSIDLRWHTQPDDVAESYLELWMEQGAQLELDITCPSGSTTQNVKLGDVQFLDYVTAFPPPTQPNAIMGVCYNPALQGALGSGPGIMLALAPTTCLTGVPLPAPHGVWKIKVTNPLIGSKKTVVDGYIERNDDAAKTRQGTRQSYFDDPLYIRADLKDTTGLALPVAPTNTADTYVRREGVFNSLATGQKTIVVGGERQSDGKPADYSPDSKDFNNTRPKRPGTPEHRKLKLKTKVTEESPTLHGLRAAGTRSGGTVRLSGTSMATPQIARDLFNAL